MTKTSYTKSSTTLFTESYSYSLDRNMVSKGGVSYTYDGQDRLKTETNKNYTFNDSVLARTGYTASVGNLSQTLGTKGQTTSYQLSGVTTSFSFDNNGNRTYKNGSGTVSYTYDSFNHLTSGNNIVYSYRPDRLMHKKDKNGTITYFVWDNGNIIAELDKNGAVVDKYAYGLERIKSVRYGYYLHDGQGDVVKLTNVSGIVTSTYTYDAYGNPTGGNALNPFRYRGEYYDADLGMYYLRARFYDPVIGEFISEDPAKDGVNWYVYCANNPVKFRDPSGLVALPFPILVPPPLPTHSPKNDPWALPGSEIYDMPGRPLPGSNIYNPFALGKNEENETITTTNGNNLITIVVKTTKIVEISIISGNKIKEDILIYAKKKNENKQNNNPIAKRQDYDSKKEAKEAAKKAGKGNEPIHHPNGEHGPHYHPDVPMPKKQTPKAPNPHDHYNYPKSKL